MASTSIYPRQMRRLGGRARSLDPPYRANYGPHALYADGPFFTWLRERELLPSLGRPSIRGCRTRIEGRLTLLPGPLIVAAARLRDPAPVGVDYRAWASERVGRRAAEAAIGYLSLPTFHHDPGEVSAAFAQERFRRLLRPTRTVRYVRGGWSVLVDALADRAPRLGVQVATGSRVTELPQPPVILAVTLDAAVRLLRERDLQASGARTVLLDVAAAGLHRPLRAVLDLSERLYVLRVTGADAGVSPAGEHLIQASAGVRPGESIDDATRRIEEVIDAGFPGWRTRETWRRRSLAERASGALDLPGSTWRDRPSIDQGNGVYLAGDAVAAPGLLSEVSFNSAVRAAASVIKLAGGARAERAPDDARPYPAHSLGGAPGVQALLTPPPSRRNTSP